MIDEGYTKYECDWRKAPPLPDEITAGLNAWRNRLYDLGLIGFYEDENVGFGNVSLREGDTARFIISGTQTGHIANADASHYARVTDFNVEANRVSCEGPVQASSEALTHALIYSLDPGIRAVVHVHSRQLWNKLRDRIPTTPSDVPYGTPEMAAAFVRLYRETNFGSQGVAVMGGHEEGIVSFGCDIGEAASRILRLLDREQ